MRIFIILLVIANILFMGVSYFLIEPKKVESSSKEERKKSNNSLVLLSELEKSELISDIVESNFQEENSDDKKFVECLKIVGDWDPDELSVVKNKMESINKTVILEGKERRKKVNYWVVIPPFDSKQDAITAKRELQSAKIVDIFIIKSGARANALSLGLYSTEEGAKRRARYVSNKQPGISKVSIEELTLYVDRYWIKVASVDGDLNDVSAVVGKGIIDTEFGQCEIDG